MPLTRLGQPALARLATREMAFTLRDAEFERFGIRVLPSGKKRHFVHSPHQGRRFRKIIGAADALSEPEVRARRVHALAPSPPSVRCMPGSAGRDLPLSPVPRSITLAPGRIS